MKAFLLSCCLEYIKKGGEGYVEVVPDVKIQAIFPGGGAAENMTIAVVFENMVVDIT